MDKSETSSKFNEFIRSTQVPKLDGLKVCWDRDLAQEIPENDCKKLCASWYCYSRETQSQHICYKILNRSYWTPSKLARLKLRIYAGDVIERWVLWCICYMSVIKLMSCDLMKKVLHYPQSNRVTATSLIGGARCYHGNVYRTRKFHVC